MDRLSRRQRSELMSRVGVRNTAPELWIRSLLHTLGYRFRIHRKDLPGTPDIVFPTRRMVIFIHGCFWHGHKCPRGRPPLSNVVFWRNKITKNIQRDARVKRQLRAAGWRVLVVWGCKIGKNSDVATKLSDFLGQTSIMKRGTKKRGPK